MNNQINNLNTLNTVSSPIDLELVKALLESVDAVYPWNPADEASAAYFEDLEQQFDWQDFLETELIASANNFYQNLDRIWEQVVVEAENTRDNKVNYLQKALSNAFSFIPEVLLAAIAQKATEVLMLEKSTGEKLVECVQTLLPNWDRDDLLVLARPFAYYMRSSEPDKLTSVIKDWENRDWSSLSEIEQAKTSLAIANYALEYLSKSNSQP
ncbi:hypothetical protein H6G25_04730 [Dolichospermum sp. FACHB-1091]|jgi:hypothetical protein|uniref:hypothetical protein n=1 Tax=Dolichospermum sp. FACHB-1091 TaxID=2692798 RepID=UPI0016803C56|nr:hypothetical protein [Dolichospermum sp. FACHB-1091]MBD2442516.1 hypothetical protein [Dolichospermum sp. FACHB-1091]